LIKKNAYYKVKNEEHTHWTSLQDHWKKNKLELANNKGDKFKLEIEIIKMKYCALYITTIISTVAMIYIHHETKKNSQFKSLQQLLKSLQCFLNSF
jgi:hypothetical protein